MGLICITFRRRCFKYRQLLKKRLNAPERIIYEKIPVLWRSFLDHLLSSRIFREPFRLASGRNSSKIINQKLIIHIQKSRLSVNQGILIFEGVVKPKGAGDDYTPVQS